MNKEIIFKSLYPFVLSDLKKKKNIFFPQFCILDLKMKEYIKKIFRYHNYLAAEQ